MKFDTSDRVRENRGFTLLETLLMLACLFILVWLCFGLWRKANRDNARSHATKPGIENVVTPAGEPSAPVSEEAK